MQGKQGGTQGVKTRRLRRGQKEVCKAGVNAVENVDSDSSEAQSEIIATRSTRKIADRPFEVSQDQQEQNRPECSDCPPPPQKSDFESQLLCSGRSQLTVFLICLQQRIDPPRLVILPYFTWLWRPCLAHSQSLQAVCSQ